MNTRIQWQDSYSVGVPVLDAQHRHLIRLINLLEDEKQKDGMIAHVFDELDAYIREHFRAEERMMEEAGYPDLEEHKGDHKAFNDWLSSVKIAYDSGGASSYYIAESVIAFLKNWLVSHILVTDMAYRSHLS
ncbi:MAG: hemerythrin family protein [Hyphomicrobiales bacterium]|nr:hemerythrin family protein [Hyphomicrobiales bacterium]